MITVGITAYNEEKTIGSVLDNLLAQKYSNDVEIVAAVGGVDKTIEIVEEYAHRYKKIFLLKEEERAGKPGALNRIFKLARGSVIVLTDGDVFPEKGSIEKLLKPFENPEVGATCGMVLPLNDRNTLFGFWAHFLFQMAHRRRIQDSLSGRLYHLTGYLCAVRSKLIKSIPENALADDAVMGLLVQQKGYRVEYVPDARVYVMFPEGFRDFLAQKRRTMAGFVQIKKWFGIKDRSLTLEAAEGFFQGFRFCQEKREYIYHCILCFFRIMAWLLAYYELRSKKKLIEIWK